MRDQVKDYYGRQLQTSADLKTSACCDSTQTPEWLKPLLGRVHPEVSARYYGCGLIAPELLAGCRLLDLGCGAGRDAYLLAQLVGAGGSVLGVDMTEQQLEVAERHREWHATAFGFANVDFRRGYLEDLGALDLGEGSFEVVVSNCVINLTTDKAKVLSDIFRLLKPGGELYFSDIYTDRRLPAALARDPLLYGECLGGALYWNDFLALAKAAGFADPRLVEDRPLALHPVVGERVGPVRFYSATYRLFRLADLEGHAEDYGQAVRYLGGIPHAKHLFRLDKHHRFERGRLVPVCGNTYRLLSETRFTPHFERFGDTSTHYGAFHETGDLFPFDEGRDSQAESATSGCC